MTDRYVMAKEEVGIAVIFFGQPTGSRYDC